ncbi:MAG: hypothetical protein ACK448_02545, partial [Bacteroidota bacterium]
MRLLVAILNKRLIPIWVSVVVVGLSQCVPGETNVSKLEELAQEPIENPTFVEHIAPILSKHCLGCHRPQGIAPFSLNSYA